MQIFWDILGIKPTTDTHKIRKAYSALVKLHNPEDDEEQFRKINGAYKAAMKFAATFAHLDLSDEQINIVDIRPDGSFGVQFKTKDGQPMFPKPPAKLPEAAPVEDMAPALEGEKLFDFDSIDSSVVTSMTPDEINQMSGMIALAPGFNVPETKMAKKIHDYLNVELDIVKHMGVRPAPGEEGKAADDAIDIATAFIKNEEYRDEKVLWQVYFLSPMVMALNANLFFYRRLEMLINNEKLKPRTLFAISDAAPNRPRVYIWNTDKKEEEFARIDFQSKVPFRYIKGEYQAFDDLMKKEDPAKVDELIKFLTTCPINLYGMLMPSFPPSYNNRIQDASVAFKVILTAPYCKAQVNNRLLWKLFFRGKLIEPIIHKQDLHTMMTKLTMEIKFPKETLKIVKKEMSYSETVFIKRKKEDKDWYYLQMLPNDITPHARSEKEKKLQVMEVFGLTLGIAIGLLIIILKHLLS